MRKIGIIANPTSGKDIRRLVVQALVVSNREKVNIVKRVLIGAHAVGAREVMIMPDRYGIGNQSVHDLKYRFPEVVGNVSILDM
jgi:predicted polyphosphate/ATP-dependent NAD kinase